MNIAPPSLPPQHNGQATRNFQSSISVEVLLWRRHIDVKGHQQLLSSAMVQYCGLLLVDRVVVLSHMLCYNRLLRHSPLTAISAFLQSRLPKVDLAKAADNLMTTGAFSKNVGKIFPEFKLLTDDLPLHLAGPKREATETQTHFADSNACKRELSGSDWTIKHVLQLRTQKVFLMNGFFTRVEYSKICSWHSWSSLLFRFLAVILQAQS